MLGGLIAPDIARRIGMRASLVLALVTFVLLHLLLGLFSSVVLAGLALSLEAAGGMLWNVVLVSYRQRLIPDDLLGRVNSVYRFFSWGAMPFGALGGGALVSMLEPAFSRWSKGCCDSALTGCGNSAGFPRLVGLSGG